VTTKTTTPSHYYCCHNDNDTHYTTTTTAIQPSPRSIATTTTGMRKDRCRIRDPKNGGNLAPASLLMATCDSANSRMWQPSSDRNCCGNMDISIDLAEIHGSVTITT